MNCMDNKDGTCTVEYVPIDEGDYDIAIKFDDEHIPGTVHLLGCDILDGSIGRQHANFQVIDEQRRTGKNKKGKTLILTFNYLCQHCKNAQLRAHFLRSIIFLQNSKYQVVLFLNI